MKIGTVELTNNIILAPMAGVTDLPFRLICKRFGAGMVCSEMVSAKALHYDDAKTKRLLETAEEESPLSVQIFGSDPDILAESAPKALSTGGKILDINMGCPAPKIANNGDGSALLKDFKKISAIVRKVTDAVSVPVTCKVRSGFGEPVDMAELGRVLEASGASAITVHGRTRQMYYSGKADWSKIAEVKRAVSIPVIGNGDIFCAADAERMLRETGCDGVMIGRGVQGNPFLLRQIAQMLSSGNVTFVPDEAQRLLTMQEHIALLIRCKGERVGVREARKHIAWYIKGMRGCAAMKTKVFQQESEKELMDSITSYYDSIRMGEI